MDHNLLVRPDLSGTDGDESPTCLLMSFGAEYWDAMGGRNLTFVNNTCLTFSGDVYSYLLDQAATGADNLADRQRIVQGAENDGPAIPPPFYHPKCVPEKMDTMYWLSKSNVLLTANASGASINCGAKSWSLAQWQAAGRDEGSRTGPLPSVEALEHQARVLLGVSGDGA